MGLLPTLCSVPLIVPGRRSGAAFERVALLLRPGGLVRALRDGREAQMRCGGGPAVRGGAAERAARSAVI